MPRIISKITIVKSLSNLGTDILQQLVGTSHVPTLVHTTSGSDATSVMTAGISCECPEVAAHAHSVNRVPGDGVAFPASIISTSTQQQLSSPCQTSLGSIASHLFIPQMGEPNVLSIMSQASSRWAVFAIDDPPWSGIDTFLYQTGTPHFPSHLNFDLFCVSGYSQVLWQKFLGLPTPPPPSMSVRSHSHMDSGWRF